MPDGEKELCWIRQRAGEKWSGPAGEDDLAWDSVWEGVFWQDSGCRYVQKAQALLIETRFASLPRRNVAQTLWGPLPAAIASNFSSLGATPALQKARRETMFSSSTTSF